MLITIEKYIKVKAKEILNERGGLENYFESN
jgi:hypothetical protein